MTILSTFGGASGVDTGDIGHSLRCRSAVSAYLSRTPAGAGSRRLLTFSWWMKASPTAAMQRIIVGDDIGSNLFNIAINASNQLEIVDYAGGYSIRGISNRLFRDPTSHVHVVVSLDTNQATFANAVRVWVNGEQITSWATSTYVGAHDMQMNDTRKQGIGVYLASGVPTTPFDRFDGYLSRIAFVDGGGSLTPSDFAYLNTEINEWVSKSQSAVKAVVDAGGTNSFMLDFDDATSLTTLGYDKSSKGNNWTLNNFSLTAGTTYDHMLDVPGNSYATIGTLSGFSTNNVVTSGNLKHSSSTGVNWTKTHQVMATGKWYWEMIATTQANSYPISGLWRDSATYAGSFVGNNANGVGYYPNDGKVWNNNVGGSILATYVTNDVIGFAFDADSGKFYVSKNGTWLGSADPAAGTNPALSGLTQGDWCAVVSNNATGSTEANMLFGQAPLHASATYDSASGGYFTYTPPTGFKALCQANIATPAILNPADHHVEVLVTKASTTQNFTLPWDASAYDTFFEIKRRDAAGSWYQIDGLRGYDKYLVSNSTAAEVTDANVLSVSGTTCTLGSSVANGTYVISATKAGLSSARQTNTDGSITSTVSRNVLSGFSIVLSVGTGVAGTIGHGLGAVVKYIVGKNRSTAIDWPVGHHAAGWGIAGLYNGTNSFGPSAYWNSVGPTTTVFSVGASNNTNQNTSNHVFYCYADSAIQKSFSYTGNGSADGPYVNLGFKCGQLFWKRSDSTGDWITHDTARALYNPDDTNLYLNLSAAESVGGGYPTDETAFGCKVRGSATYQNASGGTYIGHAWAAVGGKYSAAR